MYEKARRLIGHTISTKNTFDERVLKIVRNLRFISLHKRERAVSKREKIKLATNLRNRLRKQFASGHGVNWRRIVLMNSLSEYNLAMKGKTAYPYRPVFYVIKNKTGKNEQIFFGPKLAK